MKIKIVSILLIGAIALFASCKKTTTGPTGATGAVGAIGNANVKIYNYGTTTLTASFGAKFKPTGLTPQKIDSSLIMVYYSEGYNEWNVANGLGPNGNYATVQYTAAADTSINVYLKNANGDFYSGNDVIWQKVRVVIVPTASVFRKCNIDYKNYEDVAKYFDIKD